MVSVDIHSEAYNKLFRMKSSPTVVQQQKKTTSSIPIGRLRLSMEWDAEEWWLSIRGDPTGSEEVFGDFKRLVKRGQTWEVSTVGTMMEAIDGGH